MRRGRTRTQRGAAMVTAMGMLFAVLALGSALLASSLGEKKATTNQNWQGLARNAAEAGAEYAIWQLSQSPSWRCTGAPAAFTNASLQETIEGVSVSQGTYTVDPIVTLPDGTLQITSHGYYPSNTAGAETKTIRVSLSAAASSPFMYPIFAKESITMSGGHPPNTDSFDSALGSYADQTHGTAPVRVDSVSPSAIALSGGSAVGGALIYGPGTDVTKVKIDHSLVMDGDTDISNDFQVASEMLNPPSATIPSTAVPISTINNGSMVVSNLVIPAGTYYCDSVNISGGKQVRTQGQVILYVRGSVTISGSGFANNNDDLGFHSRSSDLQIFGTAQCTKVVISGSANLSAVVYAPDAEITKSSGSTQFYGAMVGKTVTVSGGGAVHYDRALSRIGAGSSSGFTAKSWSEM